MDLRDALLDELRECADAEAFLQAMLRVSTQRARCPRGAAYLADGLGYRRIAACGKGLSLSERLSVLPPTGRNVRNLHLPGDEPGKPLAFVRLEWDGPQIHDPEAVEALEDACVDAARLLSDLTQT